MADKLNITRRDFLNGIALSLAAGTSLSPLELLAQGYSQRPYYPPALTGLRGAHVGSFEIAHAVALAGAKFDKPQQQTDSTYDVVIVGGGISGLAAALFYQQRTDGGKVLVIDNHDDFGGHAKRNEFTVDGQTLVCYGGSQSLEAPSMYSAVAEQLLRDVGIQFENFYEYFDRSWSKKRGLTQGVYFSQEAYGRDVTAESAMWIYGSGPDYSRIDEVVSEYPIGADARRALVQLMSSEADLLAGRDNEQKIELLSAISYSDFLRKYAQMPDAVVTLLRDTVRGYWGVGHDAISALEAYRYEQPGTWGLDIDLSAEGISIADSDEPYIFHFPDGNAGVARALVRGLVPGAMLGTSMESLATARVDYHTLDRGNNATRIRLNSTVVDVRHAADQKTAEVTYIRDGKPELVRGKHVVLACYNRAIPSICSEVSDEQAEALLYGTKTPLAYVNVAVRNWRPFAELGMDSLYVPQPILMHSFELDFPVSMGDYRFTQDPDDPAVIHGSFAATVPDEGLTAREQNLAGLRQMLEMSFDDFETRALRQFDGALGAAGFDPERDITAMTVNRWPHGYAYEYSELFDPPEYDYENGPHVIGRQRIGRISIANSDSQAYAYVDGAIDAADRAVNEQLAL